jgi:hypothetical protein
MPIFGAATGKNSQAPNTNRIAMVALRGRFDEAG